jgi:CheY-like chemotaxis protein
VNYSVCIQGFSSFECATFESFFRLAAHRAPSYQCVTDVASADIVIADADRPASLDLVMRAGKLPRTLTVGAGAVLGSAAAIPRPINLMALLRMLDEIAGSDALRSTGKTLPPVRRAATPPLLRDAVAPMPAADRVDPDASHILVVDDSDLALRFMQLRLHRLRFQVSLASSGDQALQMLEMRRFAFVFLDVMMAGLDGFQTCKRIKRGAEPPRVVMLTSKGGPIDKPRGTIAGCDGYLVKPLNEAELVKVITELEPGLMRRLEPAVAAPFEFN